MPVSFSQLIFKINKKKNLALRQWFGYPAYSLETVETSQEEKYQQLGLSRKDGLNFCQQLCQKAFQVGYSESGSMFSEHLVLFAALALKYSARPIKILEIGTFDGRMAKFLSLAFPKAQITTIDLADDDPLFISSYGRQAQLQAFLAERQAHLQGCGNVIFKQMNSLHLLKEQGNQFDLIWVDGAHGYPICAIDIANAYRLASHEGMVCCDDVFSQMEGHTDGMYFSAASIETLNSLKQAKLISSYSLIFKRLSPQFSAIPAYRKYIGVFQKKTAYK